MDLYALQRGGDFFVSIVEVAWPITLDIGVLSDFFPTFVSHSNPLLVGFTTVYVLMDSNLMLSSNAQFLWTSAFCRSNRIVIVHACSAYTPYMLYQLSTSS